MSIGSTIKHLRREKDITQEEFAEYLGITSRAISQWECERTVPDVYMLPLLQIILMFPSITFFILIKMNMKKKFKNMKQPIINFGMKISKPNFWRL